MAKIEGVLALFDAKPLVKRSRLRAGGLEARGVPAILLGVAAIVFASGAGAALGKAATALPESLREARALWLTVRSERKILEPA